LAPPPPPHKPEHWPGIREICDELGQHRSNRYVAVHDDVIYGVPGWAKAKMKERLQSLATPATGPRAADSRSRTLRRRFIDGLKRGLTFGAD
jgi:hypothetical protein